MFQPGDGLGGQAALRSPSSWRNQPEIRFQLAKVWLTDRSLTQSTIRSSPARNPKQDLNRATNRAGDYRKFSTSIRSSTDESRRA